MTPRPPALGMGRGDWLAVLLLLVAAALVTASALGSEFVLDDQSKLVANPDIRRLDELPSRLVYPYQRNQVQERNDPSRPVVFLVYATIYHFFGLNPVPYHAVNGLFHVGTAVLVFLLTRLALWYLLGERKRLAPLVVALLFTVTPIQVGTVAYAYALNDVLSSFLMLLSVYCFVRTPSPRVPDVAASLLVMTVALFTKQSAVVIPLLILAFDYFVTSRRDPSVIKARRACYAVYLGLAVAFVIYRVGYFGAVGDMEGKGNTHQALEYLASQPLIILRYLASTVVPYHLAIDHYVLPGDLGAASKALAFGVCLALIVLAWRLWRKPTPAGRLILFAAAFYVIVLVPTSSFMPTVDLMVERRVYLANMGVFLVVALAWDRVGGLKMFTTGVAPLTLGLVCLQLAALGGVSISRNQTYATNEGVWLDVLRIYPGSERALNNLANVYLGRKQYDKALEFFSQLVARNPRDHIALQNIGAIYEREDSPYRDESKALGYFKASVAANPDFAEGHYNLGRLHQKMARSTNDGGLLAEAVKSYARALALNPGHALAHNNLGLAYFHMGRPADARREYEAALRLDPGCEPAKANLALLDAPATGPAGATMVPPENVPRELLIRLYEDALQRDPSNAQIRAKLDEIRRQK